MNTRFNFSKKKYPRVVAVSENFATKSTVLTPNPVSLAVGKGALYGAGAGLAAGALAYPFRNKIMEAIPVPAKPNVPVTPEVPVIIVTDMDKNSPEYAKLVEDAVEFWGNQDKYDAMVAKYGEDVVRNALNDDGLGRKLYWQHLQDSASDASKAIVSDASGAAANPGMLSYLTPDNLPYEIGATTALATLPLAAGVSYLRNRRAR